MSNTTKIYGVIALFAVGMIFSPLAASAAVPSPYSNEPYPDDNGNYLEIKKAIIHIEDDVITDIIYKTGGPIPQDETVQPFGYGVITEVEGELNVIATTSHAGLLDSEAQEDANDPILHNHYVVLGENPLCAPNLSVEALTQVEPGEVFVKGNKIIVTDLPGTAEGITPGTNIQNVASFQLEVVGDPTDPDAVCVTDVTPVEPQGERTIIFGQKDFHNENNKPDYGKGYGSEYPERSYDKNYGYEERSYSSPY